MRQGMPGGSMTAGVSGFQKRKWLSGSKRSPEPISSSMPGMPALPVDRVLAAELGGSVDEDVGVVHDTRVAGKDLDGADIASARDVDRIDEVAEEVLAVGGNL